MTQDLRNLGEQVCEQREGYNNRCLNFSNVEMRIVNLFRLGS